MTETLYSLIASELSCALKLILTIPGLEIIFTSVFSSYCSYSGTKYTLLINNLYPQIYATTYSPDHKSKQDRVLI